MITRYFVLGLLLAVVSACSSGNKKSEPTSDSARLYQKNFVHTLTMEKREIDPEATLIKQESVSPRSTLVSEVSLNKKDVFGRSFLYSATLQVASYYEDKEDEDPVDMAAIALGSWPAQFSIYGNKLRLTTDSRINHESDINTPSRLIHEFQILSQSDELITIQLDKASPILETVMSGRKTDSESRTQWVRSIEYASSDDLLLVESSSELRDGGLYEFLETITPRDRWVDANTKPIYADSDLEPLAERFGFLDSGDVYVDHHSKGRIQTKIASRYVLKNGEPTKWWVTKNIPDKFMSDVKTGLEAWNRYAPEMGLKEIVRFEGKLPDGIKIGDPRYNIIVWDNVAEAEAAWESQNSDPLTGTQLHSVIYLPLAWVNVGKEYWKNAAGAEDLSGEKSAEILKQWKRKKLLGRNLPINCIQEAQAHLSLKSLENEEDFGRELLKGVLFHEVGHALGLAHNFKGSLSFDPESDSSPFSHSIMDYNQFNEEKSAFTSLDSSDGPLLEYDRQILAVLYNEGKNLKESDPELPSCEDEIADSTEDGVDPLCLRYDIGKDPTRRALLSLELLKNKEARAGRMISFPLAINKLSSYLPYAKSIEDKDGAKKAIESYFSKVGGTASYYLSVSANSLSSSGAGALKSFFVFQEDTLPDSYEEYSLRENALQLFENFMPLQTLPEPSRLALLNTKESAKDWLLSVPAIASLPEKEREEAMAKILTKQFEAIDALEGKQLSKIRIRWINSLKRSTTAPLAFHAKDSTAQEGIDLEALVIRRIEEMVGASLGAQERPIEERNAAAKILITYAKTPLGKESLVRVKENLSQEIARLRDTRKRELVRKIWESLPE